jgi:hypothetical protein
MCVKTINPYAKCTGRDLGPNEGVAVGNRRKHYFVSHYMCDPRLQHFQATGQPVFCEQINEHNNFVGSKLDCPHCLGVSHVLHSNVALATASTSPVGHIGRDARAGFVCLDTAFYGSLEARRADASII